MHLHTYAAPVFGRSMFFIGHLGIPFALWEIYKTIGLFSLKFAVLVFVGFLYEVIGGLGITAGAHRLWSHRSYKGNDFFRFLLMIFNCIAFQGELFYWVRDHRVHHKYSDTSADPHDSNRGLFFSHMGWLLQSRTPECEKALKEVPMQDILDDWVIRFQLDWYGPMVFIVRVLLPLAIGVAITGSWRIGFFFNVCEMWCHSLHHTFLVNSAAHYPPFGYRKYDESIPPTEVGFVKVLALGEGHHNFHHTFPQDYATSEFGWGRTWNPSKRFIDFAAWMGWVSERTRLEHKKGKWVTRTIRGYEGKDD